MRNERFNLILIGFRGAGKTFYGKKLSESLRLNFIDTDLAIEENYAKRSGKVLSARSIFQQEGEFFFRALEKEGIWGLKEVTKSIIATGGGTILDVENLAILRSLGPLVYLKSPKAILLTRFLERGGLPLSSGNLRADFEQLYAHRACKYEELAQEVVDLSGQSTEEVLERLIRIYKA